MTKAPIVTAVVLVILLIAFLSDQYQFVKLAGNVTGRIEARFNRLRGHSEIQVCDLGDCIGSYFTDDPVEQEYTKLLLNKYGIRHKVLCNSKERPAGVLSQGWMLGYEEGYNAVSFSAIQRRWGNTVFEEARKEAIQKYVASHSLTNKEKEWYETWLRACDKMIEEARNEGK